MCMSSAFILFFQVKRIAMDNSGQQFKYKNGIMSPVIPKNEQTTGCYDLYRNKSVCLCMALNETRSEVDAISQCNNVCSKTNFNIYLEDFEENKKHDLKYNSSNIDVHSRCKTVQSESNMHALSNLYEFAGRNFQKVNTKFAGMWNDTTDVTNWEMKKNSVHLDYYASLNESQQYISKKKFYDSQMEKESYCEIQTKIPPGLSKGLFYNEVNKNSICRENAEMEKRLIRTVTKQNAPLIISGVVPKSDHNNLYVAPPYFTVDKFVNQQQSETNRNIKSGQFLSHHLNKNPNVRFEYNVSKDRPIETEDRFSVNKKDQLIGIQLVESSNIPLMHIESSIKPELDLCRQHGYLSMKEEMCCYNKYYNTPSNKYEENSNYFHNTPYVIHSRNRLTNQINGTESSYFENEHNYDTKNVSTTYHLSSGNQHNITFHNPQNIQNVRNQVLSKKSCPNSISHIQKNSNKETKKPNYRELINHVHALRSAISEDDLNMQIIKRTLNYQDVPNSNIPISNKFFKQTGVKSIHQNNNISKETPQKNYSKSYKSVNIATNFTSPLDLSIKTIKTKADSTENEFNILEMGHPPKFNFRPNFSEDSNLHFTAGSINIKADSLSFESDQSDIIMPSNNLECYHKTQSNTDINLGIGSSELENNISPKTLMSSVKENIVYSLKNCVNPQTCVSQDSKQGTGIKVEVTLKRTIPFDSDDEHLKKKVCVENIYHSHFDNSSINKYSGNSDIKEAESTTSFEISSDCFDTAILSDNKMNDTSLSRNEYVVENNPAISEKRGTLSDNKQDVLLAARIRTKAELKGFTFQENNSIFFQKPAFSNKNFYNNNVETPKRIDETEMKEWENACNDFVNQLMGNLKAQDLMSSETVCESNLSVLPLQVNKYPFCKNGEAIITKIKNDNFDNFKRSTISQKNQKKCTTDEFVNENEYDFLSVCETNNLSFNMEQSIFDQKTDLKSSEYINEAPYPFESECSYGTKRIQKDKKKEITDQNETTKNKSKHPKLEKNDSKLIDLTKISVVRLKREKYALKRNVECDKSVRLKFRNKDKNSIKDKTIKECLSSKTNLNKRKHNSKSISIRNNIPVNSIRREYEDVNINNGSSETNFKSIATRLRYQKQQLNCKNISIKKNNIAITALNSNNTKLKDRDPLSDPDRLFLEVYRYKRALKIPPNLITIKNPCTHKISVSLPDLDLDDGRNILRKTKNNCKSGFKQENIPKSIIDVLHSRVVKSKCQAKHSKSDQALSKPTKKRLNKTTDNLESQNNHTFRTHRNVFETKVLTSRTRMEYKMQLNKEIIREIFGGSERPASAPPEINNLNSESKVDFDQPYNCFQSYYTETCLESKNESYKTFFNKPSYVINSNVTNQIKEYDQPQISSRFKRKKSGRTYRRKFSSGFDYIRKKKKSNTNTIYKYSQIKSNEIESCISNIHWQRKSENDVSKEIQKWVLNKSVGQSALHKAARLGYIDVIVYCLEKMGLNPDHKDNAGYTPLHDACINGSLEIAKILLQYGANHSEGAHAGIRPLHEASENGHIEIVRMLLSYGADPLLETYSGQTPLMLASDSEMDELISAHLLDVQFSERRGKPWKLAGPWKIFDNTENGFDIFNGITSFEPLKSGEDNYGDVRSFKERMSYLTRLFDKQKCSTKNDIREFKTNDDIAGVDEELFEFEEANMPLPPLYLLKDEGAEKWVLLSDLCSLLKVKSKDTLLHKIFPSISSASVSKAFIRELKMCEFLEKATCLQLLCAGEKINICHSKIVLIQYNENVRKLLGVKTIVMKF